MIFHFFLYSVIKVILLTFFHVKWNLYLHHFAELVITVDVLLIVKAQLDIDRDNYRRTENTNEQSDAFFDCYHGTDTFG
jgi:hypothetical protein